MHYYNENDPKAAGWLRELIRAGLIPEGTIDERSIADVRGSELAGFVQCHFFAGIGGWPLALQLAGWPVDRPVWTGSCPCQPFSIAGKRGGTGDKRHLWPEFLRLIAERQPPTVVGEQVASPDGRNWLSGVFADLEKLAYACAGADLCAAGIGAPHIRQRLYWVANANDARREGAIGAWKQNPEGQEREAPRGKSLRSIGGSWPPGSNQVSRIPVLANGLPGVMGRCRGYGNAIVPQVGAEFIKAFLDTQ